MKKATPIIAIIAVLIIGALVFFLMREESEDVSDIDVQETNIIVEQDQMEPEMENIVGTAVATPALSTLVAALQAGDLVGALSDENVQFTVFAPTNDAFAAIQETVDTLLLPENKEDLQNVLQYHVVSGRFMSTDLSDGMEVTALNGDILVITIEEGKVMINGAEVVIADVQTSNGVVHVINEVLVP